RKRLPAEVTPFITSDDGYAYFAERLFLGDGEPFSIARLFVNPALGLTTRDLSSDRLIFDMLFEQRGARIVEARYLYLEPALLSTRAAPALGVAPAAAGLDVARLLIDQTGRVAVHARTLFRGDRCRLLFSSWKDAPPTGMLAPTAAAGK